MELRIREVDEGREEKKKHCHGITRKNTEKRQESGDPEIQAAKGRHLFLTCLP